MMLLRQYDDPATEAYFPHSLFFKSSGFDLKPSMSAQCDLGLLTTVVTMLIMITRCAMTTTRTNGLMCSLTVLSRGRINNAPLSSAFHLKSGKSKTVIVLRYRR
ncbi:hypothetical protein EVAR_22724_1 [Eumeta japonica]|uniref:Uncharacterized protein n=1 Tax=Eumeta variegata TaxID=151549 RepID=A0A4C1UTN3_EUMVA|nr:hypothetical protein EVAR_22724_1 [Eumeta japonica]